MAMTLRVVVPPHPLIAHWLTVLRDSTTPAPLYAKGLEELGRWLTYEALRDWLPHKKQEVITSEGKTIGTIIEPSIPLLAIPKVPTGLELWYGARDVLPNAQLCIRGVPDAIEKNAGVLIYTDMISDGIELLETLNELSKRSVEPKRIRVLSALSANPGLQRIGKEIPELNIYCASIDPEITERGSIKPGIGIPTLRLNSKIEGLH